MGINKRKNPFALPEHRASELAEEEFDRKQFKLWVENLPIGNVGSTARYLHSGLDRLIHQEMSAAERFEALEVTRQPLHFILDSLAGHYLMDSLPLAEREQMIARLRLDLMIKSIVGYKVILDQLHDQSLTGYLLHKNTRSAALHRVLYYLGYILLHSYQLRRDAPAFVWQEMHGIHHYAVANDLHTANSKVDPADGQERLSVDDLYKQNLLMSLSAPHGLLRSEVGKVYSILKKWSSMAELHPLGTNLSANHSFTINIQTDKAPNCCGSYSPDEIKQGWILVTDKLHYLLEGELKVEAGSSPLKSGPGMLSRGLLSRLLQAWGGGAKRTSKRLRVSGQVVVVCGLDGLYSLLGGETLLSANVDKPELDTDTTFNEEILDPNAPLTYDRDASIEGLDLSFGNEGVEEDEDELETTLESERPADNDEQCSTILTEVCAILDQSMNGYHLNYSGEGRNFIRVGDVLGINNATGGPSDSGWGFGIVRWINAAQSQQVAFGVELMGGEFVPVIVRCQRSGGGTVDSHPGFLQHLEDGVVHLIASPLHVEAADSIILIEDGVEHSIIVGDQLEVTDTFAQYRFSRVDETVAENKSDSDDKWSEFDSVWESLR